MDYPSKMNVAETKRVISQARNALAQLQGSLFHTQQLIDASIQQMEDTKELLSRVGQLPDLMRNGELLRSGSGNRADDPAKHRETPRT
jgi:hypothetical protein